VNRDVTQSRPLLGRRHGFTIAEVVISLIILSMMLLPAIELAAASRQGSRKLGDRRRGQALAAGMLAEILTRDYADPDDPAPVFGLEAAEAAVARTNFDDVDDYHNWSASPPEDAAGAALTGLNGWQRGVTVQYYDGVSMSGAVALDTGLKLITVTVSRDGVTLAEMQSFRADVTSVIDADVTNATLVELGVR